MQPEPNPYQPPTTVAPEAPVPVLRRPPIGTFLVGVWILEGGFKVGVVITACSQGFNPFHSLAQEYRTWNPLVFLLVAIFLIIETIGPWIGIYYLTGRRARTIPFDTALARLLKVAGAAALAISLALVLYLELAAP